VTQTRALHRVYVDDAATVTATVCAIAHECCNISGLTQVFSLSGTTGPRSQVRGPIIGL
jgi:hypothetical protein